MDRGINAKFTVLTIDLQGNLIATKMMKVEFLDPKQERRHFQRHESI